MSDPPDTPVLVVGQTPPPHGGQAIMIAALLEGDYRPVVLRHVRMDFSRTMEEMGRFRVSKVLRLFWLWRRIVRERRRSGARILYYPPAGPRMIPVLRDIALLLLLRPRFERTIFHFHAGGVGNFGNALPYPLRALFKRAFHEPEVAVHV